MSLTTFAQLEDKPQTVDADKCRFKIGNVQFAKDGPSSGSLKHPISILARTDKPITHWWWGRIVHDMSGIKFHKDSLPVDYCHDHRLIMGYVNEFDTEGGFTCKGALVRRPKSMAEEVIVNAENDVPYEASIFWDPDYGMVVEEVGEGASVQVNGFTFEGPGVVIRECLMRGLAICPYGQDMNATTEFNQQNQSVSLTYMEGTMPTDQKPTQLSKEDAEKLFSQFLTQLSKGDGSEDPGDLQKTIGELQTELTELKKKVAPEKPPVTMETLFSKIEQVATELSKLKPAGTDTDGGGQDGGDTDGSTGGGDGGGSTKFNFQDEFEAFKKQVLAKFSHQQDSDIDPITGDDSEPDSKPSLAKFFKRAGAPATPPKS